MSCQPLSVCHSVFLSSCLSAFLSFCLTGSSWAQAGQPGFGSKHWYSFVVLSVFPSVFLYFGVSVFLSLQVGPGWSAGGVRGVSTGIDSVFFLSVFLSLCLSVFLFFFVITAAGGPRLVSRGGPGSKQQKRRKAPAARDREGCGSAAGNAVWISLFCSRKCIFGKQSSSAVFL